VNTSTSAYWTLDGKSVEMTSCLDNREIGYAMSIRIAEHWFERRTIDDQITLLWEPEVEPLLRCNIWHVRGRDKDLLVDTGLGVCSLREAARDLLDQDVIAVATHSHSDHMGSMHEFDVRVVHHEEGQDMAAPNPGTLRAADYDEDFRRYMTEVGYPLKEELITAYPFASYDPSTFKTMPAAPTWLVNEGDIIDIGNRAFEVLHLPGHSPGSIGLWEARTGTLFSGDAIYDGPLLDRLDGSNIDDYIKTMQRLKTLPVKVVHAGHDPSFDKSRLSEIADAYLNSRGA
jgi:glyoxylase-like metal-dependent hydrolase (beta-lactamase superfamily II)